jgi:hypothetical protein
MTGDQEQFAAKVKEHLDAGSAQLRPGIAYRLQQARAAALARLEATATQGEPLRAYTLAGAGGAPAPRSAGGSSPGGRAWRWVGLVLIAAAALVGYQQWAERDELDDLEDLDAGILVSDLPIDAYLDRGFQQWLIDNSRSR